MLNPFSTNEMIERHLEELQNQSDQYAIILLCNYPMLVDAEDVSRISALKWSIQLRPDRGFGPVLAFQSRVLHAGKRKRILLPRFILGIDDERMVRQQVGAHRLDFRKESLECVSMQERSAQEGKRRIKTSSRFKGVSLCGRSGKWMASIRPNRLSIYLGQYDSEIEAARAYNQAALKYFGEGCFQNDLYHSQDEHQSEDFGRRSA